MVNLVSGMHWEGTPVETVHFHLVFMDWLALISCMGKSDVLEVQLETG